MPWSEVCAIVGKRTRPAAAVPHEPARPSRCACCGCGTCRPRRSQLLRYGRGARQQPRIKRAGFRYRYTTAGTVEAFARGPAPRDDDRRQAPDVPVRARRRGLLPPLPRRRPTTTTGCPECTLPTSNGATAVARRHARRPRAPQRDDRRRWSTRSSPRSTRSRATTASARSCVTGEPPAFCSGADVARARLALGQRDDRRAPATVRVDLRGLPARAALAAADGRGGERPGGRRRPEPRARVRRAHRGQPAPASTPGSCGSASTPAAGTPGCSSGRSARRPRPRWCCSASALDGRARGRDRARVGVPPRRRAARRGRASSRPGPRDAPAGAGDAGQGHAAPRAVATELRRRRSASSSSTRCGRSASPSSPSAYAPAATRQVAGALRPDCTCRSPLRPTLRTREPGRSSRRRPSRSRRSSSDDGPARTSPSSPPPGSAWPRRRCSSLWFAWTQVLDPSGGIARRRATPTATPATLYESLRDQFRCELPTSADAGTRSPARTVRRSSVVSTPGSGLPVHGHPRAAAGQRARDLHPDARRGRRVARAARSGGEIVSQTDGGPARDPGRRGEGHRRSARATSTTATGWCWPSDRLYTVQAKVKGDDARRRSTGCAKTFEILGPR